MMVEGEPVRATISEEEALYEQIQEANVSVDRGSQRTVQQSQSVEDISCIGTDDAPEQEPVG